MALRLAPAVGRHVRHRGEDVHAGDLLLRAGTLLAPGHLALLASANVAEVPVVRRPSVAVVSTGDELVPPGSALEFGQIVNSNGVMLAALVRAAGCDLASVELARDEPGSMRRAPHSTHRASPISSSPRAGCRWAPTTRSRRS